MFRNIVCHDLPCSDEASRLEPGQKIHDTPACWGKALNSSPENNASSIRKPLRSSVPGGSLKPSARWNRMLPSALSMPMPGPYRELYARTWRRMTRTGRRTGCCRRLSFSGNIPGFILPPQHYCPGSWSGASFSVEGKPFTGARGSAILLLIFWGICGLHTRFPRVRMQASRDVFTAPYLEIGGRGSGRAGLFVMPGFPV